MAKEFSSINTLRDINSIDRLLQERPASAFEMKVYRYNKSPKDGLLAYPEDLFLDPAHQCLMKIEVYENQESFLQTKRNPISKALGGGTNPANDIINKAQKELQKVSPGATLNEGLIQAAFSGALQKQGFGQDLANILKNGAEGVGEAIETQMAGLGHAFLAGGLSSKGTGRDSYTEEQTGIVNKNIQRVQSIYLYMPTGLETSYGINYEDENMSTLDNLKLGKAVSKYGNPEAVRDIAKRMALANTKIMDQIGEVFGVEAGAMSKYILAKDRQVVNPMTLHLFKDVKRREFTFSYTFLPRSEEELHHIYKIMQVLKYYAHPKRSSGSGRFLDYPAEFQIKFVMPDGSLNEYLPIIHKCVLTNIKIRYGEEAVFSTLEVSHGGAPPTKIEMELTFSELEILTRERFESNHGHAVP
jgi:hypothetical protein